MSEPEPVGPRAWRYRYTGFVMREHIENVECYTPGGYHPSDIGDTITNGQDSYTVIHKLGHGGYSTVWLLKRQRKHPAGQQEEDYPPVSFHALKILRADLGDTRADHELNFLQRLGQVGNSESSHPNIAVVEDSFTISGPNGQHHCLVSPLLGLSLHSISVERLTPSQRHHICQQLTSAVAFLHSHHICHGDLTPSNIAFVIPGIQSMTESYLLELLGPIHDGRLRLREGPVRHSKHGPKRVVAAASFSGFDISSLTSIRIIDFGCAFLSTSPPPTLGCPVEFFPPELLFGSPASTQSDVWQLAALVYFTYTSSYMFQPGFQVFTLLVAFIVQHYSPVPSHWRGNFVWSKYGVAEPGQLPVVHPEPDWWYDDKQPTKSVEQHVARQAPCLSAAQRDELMRVLRDMVTWEPNRRISAAEAHRRLQSPVLSTMIEEAAEGR
ncbi:kinase-like domain-containing protein [Chaetomium fimeti]|uniref:Kinase-like domain-containing protein n=1 Tax=Chaetomium fimeti TaxID=1854472 RepID=A0AAE0HK22_9PEZI|nr:kinase-like domain-containing protein [Chaetomium fimeti]